MKHPNESTQMISWPKLGAIEISLTHGPICVRMIPSLLQSSPPPTWTPGHAPEQPARAGYHLRGWTRGSLLGSEVFTLHWVQYDSLVNRSFHLFAFAPYTLCQPIGKSSGNQSGRGGEKNKTTSGETPMHLPPKSED